MKGAERRGAAIGEEELEALRKLPGRVRKVVKFEAETGAGAGARDDDFELF